MPINQLWFQLLICILAGLGAGLGTGFAGLSAAAVISPMLTVLLGVDSYIAVGIALASDVLASALSAVMYGVKKNIDIKNGLPLMFSVLAFTVLGSYIASLVPKSTMGLFSVFFTAILGVKFLIKPALGKSKRIESRSKASQLAITLICGAFIGFFCGFVGAGGGMMMLLALTSILGYDLKKAVGTSVFIMSFTALFGATMHFVIAQTLPPMNLLLPCILSTLLFSVIGSLIANKVDNLVLNRITGGILVVLGVFLITIVIMQMAGVIKNEGDVEAVFNSLSYAKMKIASYKPVFFSSDLPLFRLAVLS